LPFKIPLILGIIAPNPNKDAEIALYNGTSAMNADDRINRPVNIPIKIYPIVNGC